MISDRDILNAIFKEHRNRRTPAVIYVSRRASYHVMTYFQIPLFPEPGVGPLGAEPINATPVQMEYKDVPIAVTNTLMDDEIVVVTKEDLKALMKMRALMEHPQMRIVTDSIIYKGTT